ncbi:C4-dicarboxylate ABC transporter substrate-binding protein [Thermotoga sp. Ku-13t]|uniref:TAXI family TRAP transporter solute-binding subunit n=1 Tax=Thermotoga sp. Ku-13t TaxID=1755813 RepID=UPI0013EB53DB|nr:TAXI family TRAP transporter solute-binding subunit [Thermotoga sp. Ku-13t]KAF2958580.1 C4-dicarboxylate ABC transporter substrate-binding protein [Thermotoga sp. Ku-13t]
MKKLLIFVLMFSLFGLVLAEKWPAQLRFVSGPSGGTWFALGGTLAGVWTQSVVPTTSGTGGGTSNIVTISKGQADIGLTTLSVFNAAVKGIDPFKEPVKGTVLFANLYRQYAYFIMRKDYATKNNIKTLGDVIKKKLPIRFATLAPGTASELVIRLLFEKGYGVSWSDIKSWGGRVSFASYTDGANQLCDNQLDMFAFQVSRVASVIMDIESRTDVVILPVDEEAIQALADYLGTTKFYIEPGVYRSVTEPIPTVGDYTCLVIRENLPEDLVYKLAEALWKNKEQIAKAFADMAELNPNEAVTGNVPAHPGALKFWSEQK